MSTVLDMTGKMPTDLTPKEMLFVNKWLVRVHHVVVFKTKVLHFKIENTPIKDTSGNRKLKRMFRFLFCV